MGLFKTISVQQNVLDLLRNFLTMFPTRKKSFIAGEEVFLAKNSAIKLHIKEVFDVYGTPHYLCRYQADNGVFVNSTFRPEELIKFF